MKIYKNNGEKSNVVEFFTPKTSGRNNVEIGSATMAANSESEWAAHKGDEYSYIVSGAITCCTETDTFELKAGDAIFTPAGESHMSINKSDEDCFVIWIEVAL